MKKIWNRDVIKYFAMLTMLLNHISIYTFQKELCNPAGNICSGIRNSILSGIYKQRAVRISGIENQSHLCVGKYDGDCACRHCNRYFL
mgnify:CR=1 FL=1